MRIPVQGVAGLLAAVGSGLFLLFYRNGPPALHFGWMAGAVWLLPPLLISLGKTRLSSPVAPSRADEERWPRLPVMLLSAFAVLCLFSGVAGHPWFYFTGWPPEGSLDLVRSGPARFFLLTSVLWTLYLLTGRAAGARVLLCVLLGTQLLAFSSLLAETGGAALYRDDHPSFMFRLWAFGSIFPRLTSYTPYWNGGVVEGVIAKTGVLAPGLLLWPLWKFAAVESVYTWAVGLLYIVLVPALAVASLRIMRARWEAVLCAETLAGGTSLGYFLWFLQFGTIGANLSSAFVLPFGACIYRVVFLDRREWWIPAILVISAFFLLLWPPGAITAAAVLFGVLVNFRKLSRDKMVVLGLSAGITALLYLGPALVILRGTSLLTFVLQGGGSPGGGLVSGDLFARGLKNLSEELLRANPVLVMLGLGGVAFVREGAVRRWCAPVMLSLAVLSGWGHEIMPKLQLERMAVPLFFVATVPASILVAEALRAPTLRAGALKASLLSLLVLTGMNVAAVYGNTGPVEYVTLSSKVEGIVAMIRREVPEGGRVVFAGRTVHAYGRGHVALLPRLAGREMMACDYYAFPPELVEYNYPPRKYRMTRADTFRFLDLYNASLVITYHKDWREYLLSQPERYTPLRVSEERHDYSVFRVEREVSMFLRGEGSVRAEFNRILVEPAGSQEEMVIRYNWDDSLYVEAPAEISPYPVWKDLRFIAVRPNGAERVEIRRKGLL